MKRSVMLALSAVASAAVVVPALPAHAATSTPTAASSSADWPKPHQAASFAGFGAQAGVAGSPLTARHADVTARFTVPTVQCPSVGWPGVIPGVRIFGTEDFQEVHAVVFIRCHKGTPVYTAILHAGLQSHRESVAPGDTIEVRLVADTKGTAVYYNDATSGAHHSIVTSHPMRIVGMGIGADAVWSNTLTWYDSVPPFGSITFSDVQVNGHPLSATKAVRVNMVADTGTLLIRTGHISRTGTGFGLYFVNM